MREAVAAVFVHEDDIFVIRRRQNLRSFPGYQAFPGGKVEAVDLVGDAATALQHPLLADLSLRQRNALVRELREELSFDLAQSIDRCGGIAGC